MQCLRQSSKIVNLRRFGDFQGEGEGVDEASGTGAWEKRDRGGQGGPAAV